MTYTVRARPGFELVRRYPDRYLFHFVRLGRPFLLTLCTIALQEWEIVEREGTWAPELHTVCDTCEQRFLEERQ